MSTNCTHGTVWGGLCVECGADVTVQKKASIASNDKPRERPIVAVRGNDGRERFAIMHGDEHLVVTQTEANRYVQSCVFH